MAGVVVEPVGVSSVASTSNAETTADAVATLASGLLDIDSWSYTGVSDSIEPISGTPYDFYIRPNGVDVFIVESGSDSITKYQFSSPWDASSIVKTAESLDVSNEVTIFPQSLAFKPDGTRLYVIDLAGNVFTYNLSTPWDLDTATYSGVVFSDPPSGSQGLYFKPDGTKMYAVGGSPETVNSYTLFTPWDLSGFVLSGGTLDVSSQMTIGRGIEFSDDGTRMFVAESFPGDDVYQYNLSSAWSVSSATYSGKSYSIAGVGGAYGIVLGNDQINAYFIGVDVSDANRPWFIYQNNSGAADVVGATALGQETVVEGQGVFVAVTGVSAAAVLGSAQAAASALVAPEGVFASAVLNRVFVWGSLVPSADVNWQEIEPSNSVNWRKISA